MRSIALLAALLLGLGACAAIDPSAGPTATASTAHASPPGAQATTGDGTPAGTEPATADALPSLALAPRNRWTRVRIDPRSGFAQVWLASPAIPAAEGQTRRWIAANLQDSIPIPETGGRAESVAFLADYHCEKHAWAPVEAIWFARRDQRDPVLRERPRGPGERSVAQGTLVDVFLDAACQGAVQHRQGQARRR